MSNGIQYLTPMESSRVAISKYEDILGMTFPPIFRLFCELFDLGKKFNVPRFYHPEYEEYYRTGKVHFKQFGDWPIDISGFESLEEIFENWDSKSLEDDWAKYKFIRLAPIDIGGGLYVGTEGDMIDKIYLIVWDWEDDYKLISENIFQFIEGLEFIEDESALFGYNYAQLYRQWGDDFWRIEKK